MRFAIRQLRKSPGFAFATILTLALGIGATTAVFSLLNAVLLRPLPFPDPQRLMWVQQADLEPGAPANASEPLSYPDFFDWRARTHSVSGMACYRHDRLTLTGSGAPQMLEASVVSAEFFRVLGVRPLLGRDLLPGDERPGARVAVLSYALWQSTFGGARDALGRTVALNGRNHVIVAIMPAGFVFPIQNPAPALWTTLAGDAEGGTPPWTAQRGLDSLNVVARLKRGVTPAKARAELSVIARNLAAQYPDTNKQYTAAIVEPMLEHLAGDFRPALGLLFGAVVLVLLIACANVAGLLLASATRRRGEIALRTALGAGGGKIIRQVLMESVFLSLCGGVLGVVVSTWALDALLRYVPSDLPRASQISVDGTVLAFVTAVSLLTGLLFGVAPAWRMSRLDPALALRDGGRSTTAGRGQHRLHNWLVMAETAVGLVLLVGSGLLIRSFVHVLHVDPGFDTRHVLTARLTVPMARYPDLQRLRFYDRLVEKLKALPGVQSVAAGYPLPLEGGNIGITFQIEGRPTAPGDAPSEQVAVVTPDFFRTLRIPILSGRAFTPRDGPKGTPVIIVNERFARKYFPGENPIGKHVKADISDDTTPAAMREIVGIAGNVKRRSLTTAAEPIQYLPYAQAIITSPSLAIRTAGDPARLIGALRGALAAEDPDIPLYGVETLEEAASQAAAQSRFQTVLLACFAGMALLLSAIGLYAVLSYLVAQRASEIAVRMALGAQRKDVLGMIVRRGLTLALAGIAVGLAAAMLLTRLMTGMLYGVQPLDPATFAAVAAILLLVSLAASSAPAWRAARLDPMLTLRDN
jgi:putative ABC transport system permease protein